MRRFRNPDFAGIVAFAMINEIQTFLQIEFLSIYEPSEEEVLDSYRYAQNVRALMAKKLNIPMVERSVSEFMNKKT